MPETVYVGLGSNLQDPVSQVRGGIADLARLPQCRLLASSSLYASAPLGPQDQADFVNAVAVLDTTLSPLDLLDALQAIETAHARVRERHWGPRTLDLDLLMFGAATFDLPRLQVPHPEMHKRVFVLEPLLELTPDLVIPGRGKASQWLSRCDDLGLRRLSEDDV